jgi:Ca2+-binding RTX toxin-like protein
MKRFVGSCVTLIGIGLFGCGYDKPELEARQQALDTSACPAGSNIIVGTPGDDVLIGGNGADCIFGLGGNDRLEGGNGADVLFGGPGDDVLIGGNGDDVLNGDEGNDLLLGENGADTLNGGAGNDVLVGDNGADTLNGGDGNDVVDSGNGNDTVSGGAGADRCSGSGCESPEAPVPTCATDAACGAGHRCVAGLCVACIADLECDDGNVCTADSCQPVLGCSHPPVPNGTLCLDSTVCNGSETCQAGTCTAGTPLLCDDGLFCTGAESCDAVAGCQPGTAPATNDSIGCTIDACNEATDHVDHTPDDGACGSGFRCDTGTGCVNIDECASGTAGCDPNATCHDTPGSFSCTCNVNYNGDGHTCVRFCDPIVVNTGVTRCVAARNGSVTLFLDPNDPTSQYTEQYLQSDEPVENFCGPTAGKNLLFWYGADVGYSTLASEMHTNTWDTALVFGAVFLLVPEPITAGILAAVISSEAVKAGTLPGDMRNVLASRAPAGHGLCSENSSVTIDELRRSLSSGNPVVFLESRGEGNLHWAVVTGISGGGTNPTVIVANSANRSFTQFLDDISLGQVGGDVERSVLSSLFGLNPNTLVRTDVSPSSCN